MRRAVCRVLVGVVSFLILGFTVAHADPTTGVGGGLGITPAIHSSTGGSTH